MGARALCAGPGAVRALRGEGAVEVALHPGGYVRLGDAYALLAVPRAPRGPLTILVSGLERAPLRPGDPAWADGTTLRVGAHTIALDVPAAPAPAPGPLRPGWRAALRAALAAVPPPPLLPGGSAAEPEPPRACVAAAEPPLLPAGSELAVDLAAGLAALRAGALGAAVAALAGRGEGLTPAGDDVLAGFAAWCHAAGRPVALAPLAAGAASPLGLAYLRCAERGELPDVAARVVAAVRAGDADAARRRARALSRWGASSGAAILWGVASAT